MKRKTNPIVGMLFFAVLIYVFGDMFLDYPNLKDLEAYIPLVLLILSVLGFIHFFRRDHWLTKEEISEEKNVEKLFEENNK